MTPTPTAQPGVINPALDGQNRLAELFAGIQAGMIPMGYVPGTFPIPNIPQAFLPVQPLIPNIPFAQPQFPVNFAQAATPFINPLLTPFFSPVQNPLMNLRPFDPVLGSFIPPIGMPQYPAGISTPATAIPPTGFVPPQIQPLTTATLPTVADIRTPFAQPFLTQPWIPTGFYGDALLRSLSIPWTPFPAQWPMLTPPAIHSMIPPQARLPGFEFPFPAMLNPALHPLQTPLFPPHLYGPQFGLNYPIPPLADPFKFIDPLRAMLPVFDPYKWIDPYRAYVTGYDPFKAFDPLKAFQPSWIPPVLTPQTFRAPYELLPYGQVPIQPFPFVRPEFRVFQPEFRFAPPFFGAQFPHFAAPGVFPTPFAANVPVTPFAGLPFMNPWLREAIPTPTAAFDPFAAKFFCN
ncbi:MAG: hypothetical protein L6Q92_09745 [Phycisphaerae bacterium]|nr:hypothetical protein [Phycisphaerae bacterium]